MAHALPIVSLIRSADCSPMSRLWWRRRWRGSPRPSRRRRCAGTSRRRRRPGENGDLGRTAADVDDERAARLGHRHVTADTRSHGLVDQEDPPGARTLRRVNHRATFHGGDAHRDRDDDLRLHPVPALVHLGDEVLEHLLRHVEVGDDPVPQGTDGLDAARRSPEHLLGGVPHRHAVEENLVGPLLHRHDARFVEDDPPAARTHEGVRGPEVDPHVGGEVTKGPLHRLEEAHRAASVAGGCPWRRGERSIRSAPGSFRSPSFDRVCGAGRVGSDVVR